MKNTTYFYFLGPILCIMLFILTTCQSNNTQPSEERGPMKTFDIPPYQGWKGVQTMFRWEEEMMKAGTLKREVPRNEFLCSPESYDNFELSVKVKAIGDGLNAGIQFRTERIPDHHEVIGYQCDVGTGGDRLIWGFLYDESRRKRFLSEVDNEALLKVLHPDDWNELTVRAEGPHIQIWVNGYQTVDYTEADSTIAQTGLICVQIHRGPPTEAWYKELVITPL